MLVFQLAEVDDGKTDQLFWFKQILLLIKSNIGKCVGPHVVTILLTALPDQLM